MTVNEYDGSAWNEVNSVSAHDGSAFSEGVVYVYDGTEWVEVWPGSGTVDPSGEVHNWAVSEGSGSTVSDSVGTADGTHTDCSWVSGTWVDGYAISGNGSSAYIDVGAIPALSGTSLDAFSVVTTLQTTGDGIYFGAFNGGGQQVALTLGSAVNNISSGEIGVRIDDGENNQLQFRTAGSTFNDGNKYRIVVSKSGNAASDISVFVNGSSVSLTTEMDEGVSTWTDWSRSFYWLARNRDGTDIDGYFDATLDNMSVYDNGLTQSEAQSDYDEQPWS